MPTRTLIVGNDGANVLQGGAGAELIYGFDPNGPQAPTSAIAATRVAAGLAEPVFATAPPGDVGRLFIVEKGGRIKILDLATGATLAAPFLDIAERGQSCRRAGPSRPCLPPRLRHERPLLRLSRARPPATPRCAATRSRPATRTAPTSRRRSASPPSTIRRRAPITAPAGSASGPTACSTSRPATAASTRGARRPRHPARQDPAPRYRRRRVPGRSEPQLRHPGRQSGDDRRHRRQRRRGPGSTPSACATRSATASTAASATSSSAMSARPPSRRSTSAGAGANYGWPSDRGLLRPGGLPELHAADPRLCARQRRLGHRRLCLPRRERGPARAVLLRRFRHRPGLDPALQRRRLDRDRAHRPDQRPMSARSTTSPPSARTRAATSTSSISTATSSA